MVFDRRSFLKFIAGGAVGTLFTPFPWKIADDISIWTQNWSWIPKVPKGKIEERPSIVKFGGPEYGIMVKMVKGNPVISCGNKENWFGEGAVDPVGASCVNLFYSPARVKKPLKKAGKDKFVSISWDEAKRLLASALKTAGNDVGVICGDDSGSGSEIFGSLLARMGSDSFYFMPSDRCVYHKVWKFLLNGQGQIGFDIENSDLVLSLGADILGSWGTVLKNAKSYLKRGFKLVYVGPFVNQTAILADKRILLREEDIGKFSFLIIYKLIKRGIVPPSEILGFGEFKRFVLDHCDPEKIFSDIGVEKKDFDEIMDLLLKSRKSVVISGSSAQTGSIFINVFLALCINIFFDRINKKGGIKCIPSSPVVLEDWNLELAREKDLVKDVVEGNLNNLKILLIYRANPYYELPRTVLRIIEKIPFKVCFSTFMDETALGCDLVIPLPHPFETYEDSFTPFGSWKATYSVSKPILSKTSVVDVFSFISAILKDMGIKSRINHVSELVREKSELLGAEFNMLLRGKVWKSSTVEYPLGITLWNKKIERLCKSYQLEKRKSSLSLVALKDLRFGTSLTGILPYGLLCIREDELDKDGNMFIKINPCTARELGIRDGSLVKVKSKEGEISAKVYIDSGIACGCVGVLMGLGRRGWDEFNRNKGDNVCRLFSLSKEEGIESYYWSLCGVDVKKI